MRQTEMDGTAPQSGVGRKLLFISAAAPEAESEARSSLEGSSCGGIRFYWNVNLTLFFFSKSEPRI